MNPAPQGRPRKLETVRPSAVHLGWSRLRAALRGAGLTPSLLGPAFRGRLGSFSTVCPTPAAVLWLLERHFTRLGGDRLHEGRWLSTREEARDSARQIVARLRAAVPELGPLTLAEEHHGGTTRLVLRALGGLRAVVSPTEVIEERHEAGGSVYIQRTVTVAALVEATNALLALEGTHAFRFLPIDTPDHAEAWLAVDPAQAELLDAIDLWAAPLEELSATALWSGARAA